jgi:hypothetical protein
MDICIIIAAPDLTIPDLTEDNLFLFYKPLVLELLSNPKIIHLGAAPDNTADNDDDLILDGYFFRIICPEDSVELSVESFKELVSFRNPKWSTVMIEQGFIKTEITIDFLYS